MFLLNIVNISKTITYLEVMLQEGGGLVVEKKSIVKRPMGRFMKRFMKCFVKKREPASAEGVKAEFKLFLQDRVGN